jgi:LuxR family maltose regulon positive regulatory protein
MIDPPLLRTKISVPLIQPEFVHRPRLTQQIDRGALAPLTLLAAPAGFGKTNLLIEWTKSTRVPVAWLNLDSEDNDLRRFYRYLIGALQSLRPRLGEEALDFLQSTRGSGLEVGLTLLINELSSCPDEIVLVMDDFQALVEPAILESINYLLKHQPRNLHMVVASRSEPALDLAFLRAKGRVVEVDMEDLRFTGEEVAEFFHKTMGLQLPTETLHLLEKRTDGWITGLQMAAISLRHHSDPVALLEKI